MIRVRTSSSQETQLLAAALSAAVESRDLLILIGEIGAGKTTFVQGFGKGLGIEETITSPTFVLLHTYEAKLPLHHVDIYRLEHLQEVIDLGLMELLDEGGVALMEWGDLAVPVLPQDFLEIRLQVPSNDGVANDDIRDIVLNGVGHAWTMREDSLRQHVADWIVS